jgi:hypothetical protein
VSLTSLDYQQDTGVFKGFVRIYMDDFLADCKCGIEQDKLTGGEQASVDLLEKYLNEKLIIRINGKTLTGDINDLEISNNEMDINLQYASRRKPETIIVKCLIMTELYKDQSNMVIVKVNDFEQGVKLTPEEAEQTFKVN